ncbi:hypothetical protein PTE30175_01462 [Pandoraea terrae]|uniref:Uncharacterized protein n=1 Tax=Pandoraea terrae TaxID=1537710 RepID=A0A5E4TMQ5_9BURK|nr:hypothetical protein PTE30175_01462 [Pandoraea terrae]
MPAGLPLGRPGIGDEIDGAVQHAPQWGRHSMMNRFRGIRDFTAVRGDGPDAGLPEPAERCRTRPTPAVNTRNNGIFETTGFHAPWRGIITGFRNW